MPPAHAISKPTNASRAVNSAIGSSRETTRSQTRRAPPEYHGDVFIDPYEWLRDKSNPEVVDYSTPRTSTPSRRPQIWRRCGRRFDEIKARTKETDLSAPTAAATGGTTAGASKAAVQRAMPLPWSPIPTTGTSAVRRGTEIRGEQILLDENVEAEGHDSLRSAPPPSASTETSWRTR